MLLTAFQVTVNSTPLEADEATPVPDAAARCAIPEPSLMLQPVPEPLMQFATTIGEGSKVPRETLWGVIAAPSALTEMSNASNGAMKEIIMSVVVRVPAGTTFVLPAVNLGPGLAWTAGVAASAMDNDTVTRSRARSFVFLKVFPARNYQA
jgi:hypothetical protein